MTFTPVAGQNCDIVLELPDGTKMGFLCAQDTALRRQRASDYAPIVSSAGTETEATGSWRRWKQSEFSAGMGEEEWSDGTMVMYSEGLEFFGNFVTLAGLMNEVHATLAMHHFVDFDADIYCLNGNKVYKYDIATTNWSEAHDLTAVATELVVIGDAMYALCGDSTNGAYSTDGSSWTTMGVAGTVILWFAENAWRANANTLYSTATPKTSGSWSAGQAIGDSLYDITEMAIYNSEIYIGKEDALYTYDGSTIARVKDVSSRAYTNNFKGMTNWAGYLYFAVMSTIYRYHSSSETEITPRYIGGKDEEFYGFGLPIDFLASQGGIYVLFDNAKGTHRALLRYDGLGWFRIDGGTTDTATPTGLGWSRLQNWLLMGAGGKTYYQQRRSLTDRPADDYVASGYLITPYFDGGFRDEQMEVRVCTVEGEDLDATEKITVAYEDDRDGTWTSLGDFVTDPQSQISFSALAGAIACKELRLRLTLARDAADATKTPRLRSWAVQYKNRPRVIYVYTPQLRLGDSLPAKDQSGTFDDTAQGQMAFLDQCAKETTPLIFYTELYTRLVDLTHSSQVDWVAPGEAAAGRHEPSLILNLIDSYAGKWLTLREAVEVTNEISFEQEDYVAMIWAGDSPDLGLGKPERRWGAFTWGGESNV